MDKKIIKTINGKEYKVNYNFIMSLFLDKNLLLERALFIDYVMNLQKEVEELENINDKLSSALESAESKNAKAIEKLYCWGEVINPDFQNEMLLILKDGEVEEK